MSEELISAILCETWWSMHCGVKKGKSREQGAEGKSMVNE
jgi:hypothetical protein